MSNAFDRSRDNGCWQVGIEAVPALLGQSEKSGFTTVSFHEAAHIAWKYPDKIRIHLVEQQFLEDLGETQQKHYWPIVTRVKRIPFFENRCKGCFLPNIRDLTDIDEVVEKVCKGKEQTRGTHLHHLRCYTIQARCLIVSKVAYDLSDLFRTYKVERKSRPL
ncbi:MAG: hypothetical protein GY696_13195, partial [Gammaproteobacteria bacterium]|nr:hypothetical protein [Gammaproteobacteria bacterium]